MPINSHKLVEEFMLLANKIVAEKLSNIKLSVYRVHDLPDLQKLNDLSNYLHSIEPDRRVPKFTQNNSVHLINKLLNGDSSTLENLVLRCWPKQNIVLKILATMVLDLTNTHTLHLLLDGTQI